MDSTWLGAACPHRHRPNGSRSHRDLLRGPRRRPPRLASTAGDHAPGDRLDGGSPTDCQRRRRPNRQCYSQGSLLGSLDGRRNLVAVVDVLGRLDVVQEPLVDPRCLQERDGLQPGPQVGDLMALRVLDPPLDPMSDCLGSHGVVSDEVEQLVEFTLKRGGPQVGDAQFDQVGIDQMADRFHDRCWRGSPATATTERTQSRSPSGPPALAHGIRRGCASTPPSHAIRSVAIGPPRYTI